MSENNFVKQESSIEEKELNPMSGWLALIIGILLIISPTLGVGTLIAYDNPIFLVISIILFIVAIFMFCGLKIVNPYESVVFVLFGKYYGTLKKPGFFFVNPFVSAINPTYESQVTKLSKTGEKDSDDESKTSNTKKVSLKAMTLNNQKQKVNDELGNPIIIGTIVIWKVVNPTKAVFNVENYKTFLSIQCDSTIRNVARLYPYDSEDTEDHREKSLRGSS